MALQEGLAPLWIGAIRQSIGALVFVIVMLIRRPKFKLEKRHIYLIVMYAVFMMGLGHIFSLLGQQHINAGLASIIFSFFPLAVALFSSILMPKKEPFTLKKLLGLLIGLVGIILLFYSQGMLDNESTQMIGIVFILGSVLVNSLPNVLIKRDGKDLDPLILNTFGMGLAAILLLASSFVLEGIPSITLTPKLIFSELYLGIICSAMAFFLYFWLLQHISVVKLALSAYLTPLVAVFLGYIFYGELLSLNHYIGMLLIFTGIFITEYKHRDMHASNKLRKTGH